MNQTTFFDESVQSPPPTPNVPLDEITEPSEQSAAETNAPASSFLERFISSFFHETNIKWMLMIGAAIVTVCSLKLVHQHWDNLNETLKYLALLVYVSAFYGFSEASDRLLGLRSTSTVLRVLTLLLIPISFFSLGWLAEQSGREMIASVPLLAVGSVASWFFADSILKKFFLQRQTSFQVAYLGLAIACALPKMTDYSLLAGGLIWLLGTVGIIKINRHVFWLAEQHRKPLLFGFFPILLLGSQMVLLFASKLNWIEHLDWMGFGLVLCSFPIALTTRSVARVFRARTGGMLQTLPLSVAIPMFIGLAIGATGVALSFHGFRLGGNSTMAALPTAAVASCLAWLAARETRHAGFSWIAIVLMVIAYQCTPAVFSGLSRSIVASAATSISEARLPVAFYGLTYLPLLAIFAYASRWLSVRKDPAEFAYVAMPLQLATTVMSVLLLAISATHTKAMFLIPLVHTALFAYYAFCWKDRRYLAVALIACCVVFAAWVPYVNAMTSTQLPYTAIAVSFGMFGCVLITGHIDRLLAKVPVPSRAMIPWPRLANGNPFPFALWVGSWMFGVVASVWLFGTVVHFSQPLNVWHHAQSVILLIATLITVYRTHHYIAGLGTALVTMLATLAIVTTLQFEVLECLDIATWGASILSMLGYTAWISVRPQSELRWREDRLALGIDLADLSVRKSERSLKGTLFGALILPLADLATFVVVICLSFQLAGVLQAGLLFRHELLRPSLAILIGWLVFAIAKTRSRIATATIVGVLPIVTSSLLQSFSIVPSDHRYSVLVWVAVAWLIGVIPYGIERRFRRVVGTENAKELSNAELLTRYVPHVAGVWLFLIALGSLTWISWSVQSAGLVALLGIGWMTRKPVHSREFASLCVWANLLLILLIAPWLALPEAITALVHGSAHAAAFPFQFALLAANIIAVQRFASRLNRQIVSAWLVGLYGLASVAFVLSFLSSNLALVPSLIAMAAMLLLAAEQIREAIRCRHEIRVWFAIAGLGGALAFAIWHGWIQWTGSGSLIVVLVGLALQWISKETKNDPTWSIVTRPFRILGQSLPLGVTLVGIASLIGLPGLTATATLATSIVLAGVATLWVAATRKSRADSWASIVMLNIGIALITKSTGWSDLQLYLVPIGLSILGLVELMKQQIPTRAHKPLRLVGALTILVSPVYGMVIHESWWHMLSLMILSVFVVLLSIGMRVKLPMYLGIAFLFADLLAMLIRSAVELEMLWLSGIAVGIAVIGIAALCEVYRERILSRVRLLSVELATWN